MTRQSGRVDRDLLDILDGRDREACPVCHRPTCLTRSAALWVHGPHGARCRASRLRIPAARQAAIDLARRTPGTHSSHLEGEQR